MRGFKPYKRREHGTLHATLQRAVNELGGADKAGDVIRRPPDWIYSASDPFRAEGKKATLTWADARDLARAGATSIAEDMALLCGGVFMPPIPATAPAALHGALATYLTEHGQAVSEVLQRAADGEIDVADAKAALPEVDEALRAFMSLRAMLAQVVETGKALK